MNTKYTCRQVLFGTGFVGTRMKPPLIRLARCQLWPQICKRLLYPGPTHFILTHGICLNSTIALLNRLHFFAAIIGSGAFHIFRMQTAMSMTQVPRSVRPFTTCRPAPTSFQSAPRSRQHPALTQSLMHAASSSLLFAAADVCNRPRNGLMSESTFIPIWSRIV